MLVRSPRSDSNRWPDAYKFPAPRPHESIHVISKGLSCGFAIGWTRADVEELLPKLLPRSRGARDDTRSIDPIRGAGSGNPG